jgi:hypothetical protein
MLHIVFCHLKTEFCLHNIYKFISHLNKDISHLGSKNCQMILFRKILDFGSHFQKKETKINFENEIHNFLILQ